MTVVVCAEALKETHREPAILGCPVCELMPCPMVDAGWDRDILVNVGPNFAILDGDLKPIRLIIEPRSEIGLSSGSIWRPRLCGIPVQNEVLKEDETRVCPARLVEMVQEIS